MSGCVCVVLCVCVCACVCVCDRSDLFAALFPAPVLIKSVSLVNAFCLLSLSELLAVEMFASWKMKCW